MRTTDVRLEGVRRYLGQWQVVYCFVFTIESDGNRHGLQLHRTIAPQSKTREEIDHLLASIGPVALEYYNENKDVVMLPPPDSKPGVTGLNWWSMFLASSAMRDAGYVLYAMVAAKDEHDVRKCMRHIQLIMASINSNGELVIAEDDPIEQVKFQLFQTTTLYYCFLFTVVSLEGHPTLQWQRAIAPPSWTREEIDRLASWWGELALEYYVKDENAIFRPRPESPPISADRGWWAMIIATAPLRDAGYVLCATTGASNAKEVEQYIADIQSIMRIR